MKQKHLLAILGSPHSNGHTAKMLGTAISAAKNAGYTVSEINLYDLQLAPCKGCLSCSSTKKCVIADDIQVIADGLKKADLILLAAPVYWANVPAVVKNMFDRLFGTAIEETLTFPKGLLPGKKYMFFTSCHTSAPFCRIFGQSSGAGHSVDEFFKTSGMKCAGHFVWANPKKKSELPKRLEKKIERRILAL